MDHQEADSVPTRFDWRKAGDSMDDIVGHPDGGITGEGDGRAPDFFQERTNPRMVWEDHRTPAEPGAVQVVAPIESVEVLLADSITRHYAAAIVSGLPNSCVSFAGYTLAREGDMLQVRVLNWQPADPNVLCAQVYSLQETNVPLGSDLEQDREYTVDVNREVLTFTESYQ